MTTPSDGRPGSGLPPHLDPRRAKTSVPRVTGSYRESARGPAPRPSAPRPPVPPTAPRRRRSVGRVLSWIALTMAVLILGLAGVGYVLVQHYNGNIDRISGVFTNRGKAPAKAPHDAMATMIPTAAPTTNTTNRWLQLILGIICMWLMRWPMLILKQLCLWSHPRPSRPWRP